MTIAASSPHAFFFWLPFIGIGLGALALWEALRTAGRRRLVNALPTSKTTGVFIGLVEVKGTAETRKPRISYLTDTPCVYYSWMVHERWKKLITKSYTDSKGKVQSRTETEMGWRTVARGGEEPPFYVKDDCGLLQVNPARAEIEATKLIDVFCQPDDPLYFGKGPAEETADSDHHRNFVEYAIKLHTPVYVMGQARERADMVAPEIAHDEHARMFLISTKTEREISRSYFGWFWSLMAAGPVLCGGALGVGLVKHGYWADQRWVPFALGAGGFVVVAAVLWFWAVFNGLVDLRNRVASAWSQVDVQLKRRFDLIPRLEGAVKGLAAHERAVQEGVAALRAQQTATAPGEAGPEFQPVGGKVIALAERYPQLKTDAAFIKLQRELSETEQRIALARGYYNEIATFYNTKLEIVPERFIAALGRMKPRALFTAGEFEREAVKVELA